MPFQTTDKHNLMRMSTMLIIIGLLLGKSTASHLSAATPQTMNTFLEYTSHKVFKINLMLRELT
jgi:hypothetical protein